jgi:hypothetical protein
LRAKYSRHAITGVTRAGDSANVRALMRVVLAALGLSALSFAAGVAGDLSVASPAPPSVIVAIPPLPPNAVRAHPLPPLIDAASAAEEAPAPAVKASALPHRRAHHARRRHA